MFRHLARAIEGPKGRMADNLLVLPFGVALAVSNREAQLAVQGHVTQCGQVAQRPDANMNCPKSQRKVGTQCAHLERNHKPLNGLKRTAPENSNFS